VDVKEKDMTRKFGQRGDVVGSVEVRSGRGFSRAISLIAVTLPSGETLQLSLDDARAVCDAIQAEIDRVRGPA
jgi:NH3-dependent NAD+ synthetase